MVLGPQGGRIVRILKEFEQLEGAAVQSDLRVCSFFARIIRVWAIQGFGWQSILGYSKVIIIYQVWYVCLRSPLALAVAFLYGCVLIRLLSIPPHPPAAT